MCTPCVLEMTLKLVPTFHLLLFDYPSSSLPCEEPLPVDAWPALETLVITLGEGARTSDSLVHALADSVALRTTLRRLELPRPLTPGRLVCCCVCSVSPPLLLVF